MMRGRLYIDGTDVYIKYGVYVVEGGWNELIAYPPLKSVKCNDWQEEDGEEADLSCPVLNTKDCSVKFAVSGVFSRYFAFVEMLSDGAYHTFDCAYIQRKYRLRMTQQPNLDASIALGFFTFKFAKDFPLDGYTYQPPVSNVITATDYSIDERLFTDYGCRILQGTLSDVEKTSNVKQKLLRNINTQAGVIYDSHNVTFKSKEVKLKCLMRADTLGELWRNYDALLFDLIRPEERMLWVDEIEQEFPFYYKSCTVNEFYPKDKIWLKFTLTVHFTQAFRINEGDMVLAAENGIVIFTDDSDSAVDMLPDKYMLPTMRLVTDNAIRFTQGGTLRFND